MNMGYSRKKNIWEGEGGVEYLRFWTTSLEFLGFFTLPPGKSRKNNALFLETLQSCVTPFGKFKT